MSVFGSESFARILIECKSVVSGSERRVKARRKESSRKESSLSIRIGRVNVLNPILISRAKVRKTFFKCCRQVSFCAS